jgi:hypothetical protein
MMAAQPMTEDSSDGLVRLAASATLRAHPAAVARLLGEEAGAWLGEPIAAAPHGLRRFAVDLRLRVGGEGAGLATFRKAAFLDVGEPMRTPRGWRVELGWRASTAAPLFPVFSGTLLMEDGQLRLEGLYAPPGGVLGRVADRLLLHVAANGTARWLLDELERVALEWEASAG